VPPEGVLSGVDPAPIIDECKVTLGRVVGAGGSGVVKQGTLELRRGRSVDVAVKMISTGDEHLFETEVANLIKASRNCSGVAKIHGVCQKNGSFCIIMKLYPKTLAPTAKRMHRPRPLAAAGWRARQQGRQRRRRGRRSRERSRRASKCSRRERIE
jgi:hypothetical protein